MDRCPVEGGAAALAGEEQLISHRVIDDADDWDSGILERNRDGERRQPVSEVGRAVERVDNPAVRRARCRADAALFAEEVMLWTESTKRSAMRSSAA